MYGNKRDKDRQTDIHPIYGYEMDTDIQIQHTVALHIQYGHTMDTDRQMVKSTTGIMGFA